jgi:DNA-directed RNA polymerase subunit alpha
MAADVQVDIRSLMLSEEALTAAAIDQIASAVARDFAHFRQLREAIGELENLERTSQRALRLGIGYYLVGKTRLALEALAEAGSGGLVSYYRGKCHMLREEYGAAKEDFEAAAKGGHNSDRCALSRAEATRYLGDLTGALAILDALSGAVEQTAEYLYQRGATVAAIGGNPREVVALYERAVAADANHAGALFGLALENDRRGNDEAARELYERSAARFPAHLGALLNLGILYEDQQQYDRARHCYQRILDVFSDHPRARLFLKDTDASRNMFYDEAAQRQRDRLAQILSIPVSDFELSVRSRNCLQKMGIQDLGDLTRTTEQELLASKNFGETSLSEIRDMLLSKGLQLGQFAHERREEELVYDPETLSPDELALLERPISELNLSVRARKCMVRLGLGTIGELLRRTGDDLLECKNFGVTSLNEVREKLSSLGLKLRGD